MTDTCDECDKFLAEVKCRSCGIPFCNECAMNHACYVEALKAVAYDVFEKVEGDAE